MSIVYGTYRALVRPDWTPSYPDDAWMPVYCTWYAVHAAVEKQWLEEHVDTAAAMGFGTFIVDDGWCFDDMKRVTPQTFSLHLRLHLSVKKTKCVTHCDREDKKAPKTVFLRRKIKGKINWRCMFSSNYVGSPSITG